MLLLRLFLLVMLIDYSESAESSVEDCDKMHCYMTDFCMNTGIRPSKMIPILNGKADDMCDVILKIRSYSKKFYLIVLQSFNVLVNSLTLEQGTTKFECILSPDSTVSAKYNGNDVKLLRHDSNKLMCEFFVKNTVDVFDNTATEVKLYSSTTTSGVPMKAIMFHAGVEPTCDPDGVIPQKLGAVDGKTVVQTEVRLADLVCPSGYTLTSSQDGTNFNKVSSISCKESSGAYEFYPSLTKARCEVDTCTQCPVLPNFDTYSEGGCTKLRCIDKHMKVGSTTIVNGSAECKFAQDKHVWQVNGVPLTATDSCEEKKQCFKDKADMEEVCTNCELGPNNIPMCASGATLKYRTEPMEIKCNDITGAHYYMYDKGRQRIDALEKEKLQCDGKGASSEEKKEPEAASITPYIVGAIIGILLLGGGAFGIWWFMKKKRNIKPNVLPDQKPKDDAQGQNKDPKSANSINSKKSSEPPKAPSPQAEKGEPKPDEGRVKKSAQYNEKSNPPENEYPVGGLPEESGPPNDETVAVINDSAGRPTLTNMSNIRRVNK